MFVFIIFRCVLSCFCIYYGCVFCISSDFFVRFCLVSFFNLCVVFVNLCIVFLCFINGGIFSFLIYFGFCCDVPLNFGFLWSFFSLKGWYLLLVFLCVAGFALFQLEIHLMLWSLVNTLSTWRSSLLFFFDDFINLYIFFFC